ncbi:MAG: TonB-dependent hemoglobin/transferrin/lactoferrin family receptor [Gammaproteobacteria bacterium]|nr:TonB-dependent hemoglobin/transferrin/lactoferrin family receptor [Gammaproteobacteria bacterium]
MKTTCTPLALAPLVTLMMGTGHATANESSSDATPLETIVVTATRSDRDLNELGRSISVVDRLKIESIAGQSVADVLRYQPNISIEGGPRAGSQTVNIRGLGGNKVLQTIDGARLSFESGHRPSYYLDPELLRNVEALRGPASSLWGSGALGGIIAQNTIAPADLLNKRDFGSLIRSGYNSNNDQITSTVAFAGRGPSADWLVSAYYRHSDDVELGNGEILLDSASEDHGMLAKVNWQVAEHHTLGLNVRANEVDGSVPANGTAEPNETSNFVLDRDSETVNTSLLWSFNPDSPHLDTRVLAYWNRIDIAEARISDSRTDDTELDEYGLNLSNISRMAGITLQYGADIYREEFAADRSGTFRPTPPEATTDVWSAYTQAEIPINEQWRLDLGMRYDNFSTAADNLDTERSADDTSMSAALVWSAADWATLALRYDEAFRAPTAEELYTTGTHFCLAPGFCNGFVPNPELKPEQAANVELFGQFYFSNALGADLINLQASVFRNEVDDFIEQVVAGPFFFPMPNPGTTTWVNVDNATLEGLELQGSYQLNALSVSLAYGQTRGEDNITGEHLTNIPADTLIADLSYGFLESTLVAGIRVTDASSQRRTDYAANESGAIFDEYTVTDLYASWQPSAMPGLKIDLNINNIEDDHYSRAWDQVPEAGREIILFARYSF